MSFLFGPGKKKDSCDMAAILNLQYSCEPKSALRHESNLLSRSLQGQGDIQCIKPLLASAWFPFFSPPCSVQMLQYCLCSIIFKLQKLRTAVLFYREELELERLRWRRRPGERDRRRTGDLRLGERDLLLMRGGDLRHIGGGGNILLGGLNLLGGGLGQGANTAVAVIS